MAGRRRALVAVDLVVGHAGEVVVGLVVFAHVVEAEIVVLALVAAALGGTIAAHAAAALDVAGGRFRFLDRAPPGGDADAVEIF